MSTGIKPPFGVKDYGTHFAICLRYKISKQDGKNIAELFGLRYDESTHDCIKFTGVLEFGAYVPFREMIKTAQLQFQVELAKGKLYTWEEHLAGRADVNNELIDDLPF